MKYNYLIYVKYLKINSDVYEKTDIAHMKIDRNVDKNIFWVIINRGVSQVGKTWNKSPENRPRVARVKPEK